MKKTLFEYATEADREYKIVIQSIEDVKEVEAFRRIQTVLDRYGCIETKVNDEVAVRTPKEFPGVEFAFVTKIEATLLSIPETGAVAIGDQISMETQIQRNCIHVQVDGEDAVSSAGANFEQDEDYTPVLGSDYGDATPDYEVEKAQDLVGTSSIKSLIDRMEKEDLANIRSEEERVRKFVTSHLGLKDILGESRKTGYYVCEYKDGQVLIESGPEKTRDPKLNLVKSKKDVIAIARFLGETEEIDDRSPEDIKTDKEIKVANNIKTFLGSFKGFTDIKLTFDLDTKKAAIDIASIDITDPSVSQIIKPLENVATSPDTIIPSGPYWEFEVQDRFIG